jgi:uncharacterized membrane protein
MSAASQLFTDTEKQELVKAIAAAELQTSGEIRLHIENKCKGGDAFKRGLKVFTQLNMHKTALRNGVLFYIAAADRKFSIIADEGINQTVPSGFWDQIKEEMQSKFIKGEFVLGLLIGIEQAGQQLEQHFPRAADDENELSNEISFGDEH